MIWPCREDCPDWVIDGVSPSQAASCGARSKRFQSAPELEMDRKGGERVDAAKGAQPGNLRPPALVKRQLAEALSDRRLSRGQPVDLGDEVGEGHLGRRLGELLTRQPGAVRPVPCCSAGVDAAMPEQKLGNAMAGVHQIAPAGVVAAHQIAGGLDLRRRDDDGRQAAGQQQPRQQLGVLLVGLDPVRWAARRLARRDHLHRQALRGGRAVQAVARRASLIAGTDRALELGQPRDRLIDPGPKPRPRQLPGQRADRRRVRRTGMDIQPNPRHRLAHGRTSSIWGQPEPFSGQTSPREERPATSPGSQPARATTT